MTVEVEVKGYVDDEIVRKIVDSYEILEEKEQSDLYFDHPCWDFVETDEALRLRVERTRSASISSLTYKGPRFDPLSKTREEIEVKVDDPKTVEQLLLNLGFKKVCEVRKRRKVLRNGGILIFLDDVEDLGRFVEAEMKVENKRRVEEVRNLLISLLRSLGVRRLERRSYLEMVLERRRRKS